jgi:Protein of unknown function (DUF3024)
MAFNEMDLKRIAKAAEAFLAEHRPPVHIRPKLDFEYRVDGQSVELLEVRPKWDRPTEIMKRPIAKTTYVRTQNIWKIYWMRGNLTWHPYETSQAKSIDGFFALVGEDKYGCFFG